MNDFESLGFVPDAPNISSDFEGLGFKEESISSREPSLGQYAASLGKGAVSGFAGAIPDTAALIYNLPAMLYNWQSKQQRENPIDPRILAQAGIEVPMGEIPIIPSATEAIEKGIDTSTEGYTETPEEMKHLYEGAKFAGSLAGFGGLKKVGQKIGSPIVEQLGKTLGVTKPTELAGAAATGTTMSALDEELGPLAGLIGGAATGALTTKGLQGLKGTITGKGPSLGEMTIGKAISLMGEPSQAVENLAKKYSLDLPFNVRVQGPVANFMANIGMSTIFRAKKYSDLLENSPKQLVDTIVKKIDSIHPENLGKQELSHQTKEFLQKEQEKVKNNYTKLYETARSFLNPSETISMDHTVKSLKELRDILTAPSPSAPQKYVMKRVNELADHLGVLKNIKPPKGFSHEQWMESPKLYEKVVEALEKNKDVKAKIHDMVQQRSAFLFDTDYGEMRGVKSLLGKLASALNQDISASPNKNFVDSWKAANSYYRMESANRVRSSLANSLTEGVFPKEAYDFMTTPSRINQLQNIIGNSTKGTQIFNSLKRAKLNDVVIDKIVDKDGHINHATFVNLFSKGNKQQDMLKALLGKENYHDLQELTELSKYFSKASAQFQNFSGTTKTAQDLVKLGSIGKGLIDIATTGGTGLLLSGIGYTAGPYVLSKVLSNPRYVNAAVKFGEAIKNKNVRGVDHYNNTLRTIFYDTLKREAPTELRKQTQKNQ